MSRPTRLQQEWKERINMSLGGKTLLILLLMGITLTTVVYLATRWLLLPRFLEGERHDVLAVLARARSALTDESSDLRATAGDYGAWDRTYAYMRLPSSAYTRIEYQDETLQGLRVNSVALLDVHRAVVYFKVYDSGQAAGRNLRMESVASSALVKRVLASSAADSGVMLLPEGPVLIAASPILRSDRTGPSRGVLVMTRKLDKDLAQSLQAVLDDDLSISTVSGARSDPDFAAVRTMFYRAPGATIILPLGQKRVAGYRVINDVNGAPALWVRVTVPRTFLEQGVTTLHYLLAGLILTGTVFVCVTILLLKRAVLARVTLLNAQIARIGERRDLGDRVHVPGRDELARLGDSVNTMLAALQQGHSQFRLIAENIDQALWMKDENTQKLTYVTPLDGGLRDLRRAMLSDESNLLKSVHPEDRRAVEEMLERESSGIPGEAEFRITGPDDDIRWVWRRHFPVFDPQGKLKQTVGVTEDVTDYKNAEEALLKSQEELWNVMLASAKKASADYV